VSLVPAFEIGILNAWVFMIWLLIQDLAVRLVSQEVYQRAGHPSDMKTSYLHRIAASISMPL